MKHFENTTFEKFASKKQSSSAHKEKDSTASGKHKQDWRQERKNVRENKRYSGEFV